MIERKNCPGVSIFTPDENISLTLRGPISGWIVLQDGDEMTLKQREEASITLDVPSVERMAACVKALAGLNPEAVPDLLAACENLENDDGNIPQHAWDKVQAALAKAKAP